MRVVPVQRKGCYQLKVEEATRSPLVASMQGEHLACHWD